MDIVLPGLARLSANVRHYGNSSYEIYGRASDDGRSTEWFRNYYWFNTPKDKANLQCYGGAATYTISPASTGRMLPALTPQVIFAASYRGMGTYFSFSPPLHWSTHPAAGGKGAGVAPFSTILGLSGSTPALRKTPVSCAYTPISVDYRGVPIMIVSGGALTGGDVEYAVVPCRAVGAGSAKVYMLISPTNRETGGGLGGGGADIDTVMARVQIERTKYVRLRSGRPDEYVYITLGGGGGEGGIGEPGDLDPSGGPDGELDGSGGTTVKMRPGAYERSQGEAGSGRTRNVVNIRIVGGYIVYTIDYVPGTGHTFIIITGWRTRGYSGGTPKRLPGEAIGESGASPDSTGNPFDPTKPYQPGGKDQPTEGSAAYPYPSGGSLSIDDATPGADSGGYTIIDLTEESPYGSGGTDDEAERARKKKLPLTHNDGGDDGNSPGGEGLMWPNNSVTTVNTEYLYGSPGKGSYSPYAHMGISAGLTRMVCSIDAQVGGIGAIRAGLTLVSSKVKALQGVIGVVDAALVLIRCKLYPRPANPARLVMATNTLTGAVSTYEDFPFNAFCELGGVYFGSGPDGVCRLDVGDTDVDAPISAGIGTGYSILGDSHQKRLINAYVKARIQSPLRMKVSTDERSTDEVALTPGTTDKFVNHRVAVARGLRGKHWMFEVNNTDGGRFDLGHIEVEFAPSTRRV